MLRRARAALPPQARNAVALDRAPLAHDFALSSTEFCDHLRKELRSAGNTCAKVIDWTHLAESMEDVVRALIMIVIMDDNNADDSDHNYN